MFHLREKSVFVLLAVRDVFRGSQDLALRCNAQQCCTHNKIVVLTLIGIFINSPDEGLLLQY